MPVHGFSFGTTSNSYLPPQPYCVGQPTYALSLITLSRFASFRDFLSSLWCFSFFSLSACLDDFLCFFLSCSRWQCTSAANHDQYVRSLRPH